MFYKIKNLKYIKDSEDDKMTRKEKFKDSKKVQTILPLELLNKKPKGMTMSDWLAFDLIGINYEGKMVYNIKCYEKEIFSLISLFRGCIEEIGSKFLKTLNEGHYDAIEKLEKLKIWLVSKSLQEVD